MFNLFQDTPREVKQNAQDDATLARAAIPITGQTTSAIFTDWSTGRAVRDGFKLSSWVYACITLLMKSSTSVDWIVETKQQGGAWEQDDNHPLALLLQKPNPWFSWPDIVQIQTAHLLLGGNGLLYKVRAGRDNLPVELWIMRPDSVKIISSKNPNIWIRSYRVMSSTGQTDIAPRDVLHVKLPDPDNLYWGMSPLQAAARTVDTEVEAIKWNKVSLQNRAVADGAIVFKEPLTREQYDDAKRAVREQHSGADNAREPWVLDNSASWVEFSMSPVEMDFIKSRRLTREEICGVFGVPPPLVGIYDKATLANIETARKILWFETVFPFLDYIRDDWNFFLSSEYGDDVRIAYSATKVRAVIDELVKRIGAGKDLFAMGVPFNEINMRLGLGFPEIAGGSTGWIAGNLQPVTGSFGDTGDI